MVKEESGLQLERRIHNWKPSITREGEDEREFWYKESPPATRSFSPPSSRSNLLSLSFSFLLTPNPSFFFFFPPWLSNFRAFYSLTFIYITISQRRNVCIEWGSNELLLWNSMIQNEWGDEGGEKLLLTHLIELFGKVFREGYFSFIWKNQSFCTVGIEVWILDHLMMEKKMQELSDWRMMMEVAVKVDILLLLDTLCLQFHHSNHWHSLVVVRYFPILVLVTDQKKVIQLQVGWL